MGTTPATKGSRERDINHTLDIYVATFKTGFEILREFLQASNTASSKRLQYVWTIFPTQNPINSFACKGSTLIYRRSRLAGHPAERV